MSGYLIFLLNQLVYCDNHDVNKDNSIKYNN